MSTLRSFLATLCIAGHLAWQTRAQVVFDSLDVNNSSWSVSQAQSLAQGFTLGAQSGLLGKVTLHLGNATGPFSPDPIANPLVVSVYDCTGGSGPGNLLTAMSGDTSLLSGTYEYFPASQVSLGANTTYFVVLSSDTPSQTGYRWIMDTRMLSPHSPSVGTDAASWFKQSSLPSGTWSRIPGQSGNDPLFSMQVTLVPEPGSCAWATGLGLIVWIGVRTARRVRKGIRVPPPSAVQ